MSDNPETIHDVEISLVSADGVVTGRLMAQFSGVDYTVRIVCADMTYESTAWNFFQALVNVRLSLEGVGLKPAVVGACRNVYPSRMSLEMGGGRRAYLWPLAERPATVDIFDGVPDSEYGNLVFVDDQKEAVRRLRSKGSE
ncbi:hypothetical protein [Streptomyces sp. MJM1172]|uniref:hypothetical protein n=1 Tax=Streptomyces sp. MJM1172 TaxID=1703926 RepID=UPI0013018A0D|nr:hypothetical protein [Streptomyces sp. MJM1172]